MANENPLSSLTSLTESYGGYDGDTVEELRETCSKLRQHAKELQSTVDALTEGCKKIASVRSLALLESALKEMYACQKATPPAPTP